MWKLSGLSFVWHQKCVFTCEGGTFFRWQMKSLCVFTPPSHSWYTQIIHACETWCYSRRVKSPPINFWHAVNTRVEGEAFGFIITESPVKKVPVQPSSDSGKRAFSFDSVSLSIEVKKKMHLLACFYVLEILCLTYYSDLLTCFLQE